MLNFSFIFTLCVILILCNLQESQQELTQVFGTGNNEYGQLGDGYSGSEYRKVLHVVQPKLSTITNKRSITQISSGCSHTLYLDYTGKVYATGHNQYGQLGDYSYSDRASPVSVFWNGVLVGKSISKISAGCSHSLLLDSNGFVYGMGLNEGRLGAISNDYSLFPRAVYTESTLKDKRIVDISAGESHSLLLDSDGKVYAMGLNNYGQLGDGTLRGQKFPNPVKNDAYSKSRIIQLSAGYYHSILVASDGKVYGMGRNEFGQLGDGTIDNRNIPVKVDQSNTLKDKQIILSSCGYGHTILLDNSGMVYGMGLNDNGQLGSEISSSYISPVSIVLSSIPGIIRDISAGRNHTILLTNQRKLYSIGNSFSTLENTISNELNFTKVAKFSIGHSHLTVLSDLTTENCSPGQIHDFNTGLCSLCPEGFYCPKIFEKYSCPNGKWSKDGSTSFLNCLESACPEGYSCENGQQQVCPNGEYRKKGEQNCENCSFWQICENGQKKSKIPSIAVFSITIVILISLCSACICFIVLACIPLSPCYVLFCYFCRAKQVTKRKSALAKRLLEGFEKDAELDELDEDANRAKLMIKKSLLEINFNELKINEKIGSGGSGSVVFKAQWNELIVAMKVYNVRRLTGENHYEDFEKELSIMSGLRHPRLVSFYGACLQYPRIGLVLEFCNGGTLSDIINKREIHSMSKQQILKILSQICEGMIFLHNKGVIHRDLKLENVLLNCGEVKIADFGLARHIDSIEQVTHMTGGIGTSYYCAPEVTKQLHYDNKCDIYSFSMMMYELFSGKMHPFGEEIPAMYAQMQSANNPSFRPDIKIIEESQYSEFTSIITSCWDSDPSRRPSFKALLESL